MKFGSDRAVLETEDFRRIVALPRRTIGDASGIAAELTKILKTPDGTMSLRPIQALALYEIGKYGGLFGPIRVGGGKTLLSLLVPFVLNARAPVLLLPASLIEKTEQERRVLAKHWRVGSSLRLISYESLGREGQAHALDFYRPDVIIADEAHRLKNKKAGVTRRVVRYMRDDPRTKKRWEPTARPKFVGISGTMLKGGSIKSFAHLLRWSHAELSPIPLEDNELDDLADALDEGSNPFNRTHPGPWLRLATDEERAEGATTAARKAFHRRLTETPGVVSTGGDQVACSLYVRAVQYKVNEATERNFLTLRGNGTLETPGWLTPDGWPLSMATEIWRVARELALGFHGVWDPRPPQEWLNARKNWAAFVRETLSHSRTLDTELQVAKACARGDLEDEGVYEAWREIKDSFRVNPRDVWHDTSALEACEAWIKKGPGIVWIDHSFFGDELERRTGVPYFREGGLDKKGNSLSALSELIKQGKAKLGPILASRFACSTGFNLQPWSRNLLTSCPSGAGTLEQLIGRTHRDGQEADTVEVDLLLGCIENAESWERAMSEARMATDTMGDSQKILVADVMVPSSDECAREAGYRWRKTKGKPGARDEDEDE